MAFDQDLVDVVGDDHVGIHIGLDQDDGWLYSPSVRSLGIGCPSSRYAVSPGASLVLETVGLGTVGFLKHILPELII